MGLCAMLAAMALFVLSHVAYSAPLPTILPKTKLKEGSTGAVTCGNAICSRVGIQILEGGGNAADAAVATQFCLGVISPDLTGLGGGGFALIRARNGTYTFVDFREAAPAAASENMYQGNETASLLGGLSIGVPGELRGLQYIYEHFCSLSWEHLIRPAAKLAHDGFPLYQDINDQITYLDSPEFLVQDPSWATDFAPNGTLLSLNETLTRKRYSKLLDAISENGPDVFYTGSIAEETVRAVQAAGGIWTLEDLKGYKVVVRPALEITYRDYRLMSSGAPSGGPVTLSALKTVEGYSGFGDASQVNMSTHRLDEALRFAFGERTKLADPSFVPGMNEYQLKMLDEKTASEIRSKISDDHTLPVEAYNPDGLENLPTPGTSNLETADHHGMVIALTSTINNAFGSRFMIPETGLIMNDEMNDFSIPGSSSAFGLIPSLNNYIKPGKRPQSSISPVIVEHVKTGALYFAVGAAGGSKIITAMVQALWHVLDHNMNSSEALAAPRFHDQLEPNQVLFEQAYDNGTVAYMVSKGHNVSWFGWRQSNVHALRLLPDGTFEAASEPYLVNSGAYVY